MAGADRLFMPGDVRVGIAAPPPDASGFVLYGWDCVDCQGDFGVNDRCDSCGGNNRIPLWALEADAERMEDAING